MLNNITFIDNIVENKSAKNDLLEANVENFKTYMVANSYSDRTIETYEKRLWIALDILRWQKVLNGSEITQDVVTALELKLQMREYHGKLISSNTVREYVITLLAYLKWMWRTARIEEDVSERVKVPRWQEPEDYRLPVEGELKRILDGLDTSDPIQARTHLTICLGLEGIRNHEIRQLTMQNVKISDCQIVHKGKGKKPARVNLSPYTMKSLRNWIKNFRDDLMHPDNYSGGSPYRGVDARKEGLLIVSKNGNKMTGSNLLAAFHKAAQDANLSWLPRFHSLKGAMIRSMYNRGAKLIHLKRIANHKRASTTIRYCKHQDSELKSIHSQYHPLNNGMNGGAA